MVLRLLREPADGRPGPLARMITLLVVLGLLAGSSTALWPAISWVVRVVADGRD